MRTKNNYTSISLVNPKPYEHWERSAYLKPLPEAWVKSRKPSIKHKSRTPYKNAGAKRAKA